MRPSFRAFFDHDLLTTRGSQCRRLYSTYPDNTLAGNDHRPHSLLFRAQVQRIKQFLDLLFRPVMRRLKAISGAPISYTQSRAFRQFESVCPIICLRNNRTVIFRDACANCCAKLGNAALARNWEDIFVIPSRVFGSCTLDTQFAEEQPSLPAVRDLHALTLGTTHLSPRNQIENCLDPLEIEAATDLLCCGTKQPPLHRKRLLLQCLKVNRD